MYYTSLVECIGPLSMSTVRLLFHLSLILASLLWFVIEIKSVSKSVYLYEYLTSSSSSSSSFSGFLSSCFDPQTELQVPEGQ